MAQVAVFGHMKPKSKKDKGADFQEHQRSVANTWWDPKSLPSWLTEECYTQRIQPLLRSKKVREIADIMRASKPYAAFVRSGRRRPHPRHWLALAEPVGVPTVPTVARMHRRDLRPEECLNHKDL